MLFRKKKLSMGLDIWRSQNQLDENTKNIFYERVVFLKEIAAWGIQNKKQNCCCLQVKVSCGTLSNSRQGGGWEAAQDPWSAYSSMPSWVITRNWVSWKVEQRAGENIGHREYFQEVTQGQLKGFSIQWVGSLNTSIHQPMNTATVITCRVSSFSPHLWMGMFTLVVSSFIIWVYQVQSLLGYWIRLLHVSIWTVNISGNNKR